jgi:hypothetical protein
VGGWSHSQASEGEEPMKSSAPAKPALREPDAHVMMRHAKTVVRVLLILSLVSTIVALLFFRPAAYLAAIPIPILFAIYLLVGQFERQSRAAALRDPGQATISQEEVELDVQDVGIYTGLGIAFLLALGTFIIAASVFDWALVGIVATGGFLLAVLINIPYLSLIVEEAERDEREKVTHQSLPSEGSEVTAEERSTAPR